MVDMTNTGLRISAGGLLLISVAGFADPYRPGPRETVHPEEVGDTPQITAHQVIARHVEAVGGREAIQSIRTMFFRGRILRVGYADDTLYRYYEQPNLLRVSRSLGSGSYTVCDGENVWSVTPEGKQEVDEWWARSLSHHRIDGNFIDYEVMGIEYEYLGEIRVDPDPNDYHHLRRSFPDGIVEELYFDVDTGLLSGVKKVVSPTENHTQFYLDYRDVGGVLTPHIWLADTEPPHVLVIEETRINEDFGEGFFTEHEEMPMR
jgi:hypothetical protein